MTELLKNREYKKEKLKELLMKLHKGTPVDSLKKEFKDLLRSISPLEIPILEQELVKEGVSPKEIVKMCDLHVELFRESVAGQEKFEDILPGHPIHTMLEENSQIIKDAELLNLYATSIANEKDTKKIEEYLENLRDLIKEFRQINNHYTREEMLLFPYLERMGITAVPTVLWTKHDEIRFELRQFWEFVRNIDFNDPTQFERLKKEAADLSRKLVDMVFRENNILYPTLKALLPEGAWVAVRNQEDEIGYYKVEPGNEWVSNAEPILPYQFEGKIDAEKALSLPKEVQVILKTQKPEEDKYQVVRDGDIPLDVGYLLPEEINIIMKNLPVDVTFIDKNDRVRYFSGKERVFNRSPAIIGRPVQLCHPPKSVYMVNRILKAFKEGKRDYADFWIQMNGRFIYIKYIPLRDKDGNYIGTLEITQDITELRKLEGEKRLLDWE
ncbi:MAG: DUF438 domain-containing protein [Candidatus Asgardarchaeia archaeon]